jgi:glutamyl-tRNA reductase
MLACIQRDHTSEFPVCIYKCAFMSLIALGINHRTAPVELRERVAFTGEHIADALRDLVALPSVSEAAILSTCNRTELYCGLQDERVEILTDWLARFHTQFVICCVLPADWIR